MTITFNGKSINIPEEELDIATKNLEITYDEAIEMWLDDHGYTINEEQIELDEKAKNAKVSHDAQAIKEKKTPKKREKKENPTKKTIISEIYNALTTKIDDISSISIRNDEKYIDFKINNIEYTINLVAHREKKEKK